MSWPRARGWTIAALLACLAPRASAAMPPALLDRWISVTTPHFELYTDLGEKQATDIARQLERFRQALEGTTQGLTMSHELPTRIYAFKDDDQFRPYKLNADGTPRHVAGYFHPGEDAAFLAFDASAGESFNVVFHEYVHRWLYEALPGVPLWLNEGLAEFYSTFRGGKAFGEIGRPVPHHVAWFAEHRPEPVADLFNVREDSPRYNEASRQGGFYAESWALTHYLVYGAPGQASRFGKFLTRIRDGGAPQPALLAAFELHALEELQAPLELYVRRTELTYSRWDFSEPFESVSARVRAVSPAEAAFRLTDLLIDTPGSNQRSTLEHLDVAEQDAAWRSRALARRGRVHEALREPADADRLYHKALDANPDDADIQLTVGRAWVQRWFAPGLALTANDTTPAILIDARNVLGKARSQQPEAPNLAEYFGRTFLYEHDNAYEGIEALMEASTKHPSRTDLLVLLVQLEARGGQRAAARALLDTRLAPIGSRDEIREAEIAILSEDIRRADQLCKSNRCDAADSLLEVAGRQAKDPEVQRMAAKARESYQHGTAVQDFNRGVEAANAERFDEAVKWFTAVAAKAEDPQLRSKATLHIAEIAVRRGIGEAITLARAGKYDAASRKLRSLTPAPQDEQGKAEIQRLLDQLAKYQPQH